MQKARRHGTSPLRPLVSTRFQVLFHSAIRGSFHLSLTVLVHYRSLRSIQPYQMVLAVSHKASPTSRYSGYHYPIITYVYAAIMRYGQASHPVRLHANLHVVVLQPQLCRNITGLGFFPFARHYSGNHYYFLFLCLLRCFSSAGLRYCNQSSTSQVAPFGNLRINSYVPIPEAYRSLSRPSSPLRAQASPVCSYLLSFSCTIKYKCRCLYLLSSLSITSFNMSKNFFKL